MNNIFLVAGIIATLAASLWLALEGSAALALPLVIIFAGLVRTLIRRMGRRGIIRRRRCRRPRMTIDSCESSVPIPQLPRCIAAACAL